MIGNGCWTATRDSWKYPVGDVVVREGENPIWPGRWSRLRDGRWSGGSVPMFPGAYVPRYRCSPVSMFPGTYVPRTYVPRYLCSPVPMFPEPMFPSTYVPRYLCSTKPMFPGTYVPRYRCSPNLCSPVPMFPDLLQMCWISRVWGCACVCACVRERVRAHVCTYRKHCPSHKIWSYNRMYGRWWGWSFDRVSTVLRFGWLNGAFHKLVLCYLLLYMVVVILIISSVGIEYSCGLSVMWCILSVYTIWVFWPCHGWVSKKKKYIWIGGGWVGWAISKFILDFWNFFNFAKPLSTDISSRLGSSREWMKCQASHWQEPESVTAWVLPLIHLTSPRLQRTPSSKLTGNRAYCRWWSCRPTFDCCHIGFDCQ